MALFGTKGLDVGRLDPAKIKGLYQTPKKKVPALGQTDLGQTGLAPPQAPMYAEEAPPTETTTETAAAPRSLTINGQDAAGYLSQFRPISELQAQASTTWDTAFSDEDRAAYPLETGSTGLPGVVGIATPEKLYDAAIRARNNQVGGSPEWKRWNDLAEYMRSRHEHTSAGVPPDVTPRLIYSDNGIVIAKVFDYEGQTYLIQDLTSQARQLLDLQDLAQDPAFDFDAWMAEHGYEMQDITESEAWAGLQALIQSIQEPETQQEWQAGGLDWAGQVLGLGEEGYGQTMSNLLAGIGAGQEKMALSAEGGLSLTPDAQRSLDQQIARTREDGKLLIESLVSQGRSAQAFYESDRILSTIADKRLEYQLREQGLVFERLVATNAAKQQQYEYMVGIGQMSATEYIQRQREHAGLEVTLFATQISQIEAANRQYLLQHQQDLTALQTSANLMYQNIVMGMNIEQSAIDSMQNYYDTVMAPYTVALQQQAIALEQQALDSQERQNMWSNTLALIGMGIGAIFGAADVGVAAMG